METSQTQARAHRQVIYQAFVDKEAAQVKTAEKNEALAANHVPPVEQANPSLPDHVGGTVNVRA